MFCNQTDTRDDRRIAPAPAIGQRGVSKETISAPFRQPASGKRERIDRAKPRMYMRGYRGALIH
jgi:hypothetical protein